MKKGWNKYTTHYTLRQGFTYPPRIIEVIHNKSLNHWMKAGYSYVYVNNQPIVGYTFQLTPELLVRML